MNDDLTELCRWLQNTPVGLAVAGTLWGYPFVQMIHFFGLSIWVGTIAMLDLRLIGLAGKNQKVSEFSDQLFPWTWAGLFIVVTGGVLLFSANAETYLNNPAFQVKFLILLFGIFYHVVVLANIRNCDRPDGTSPLAKFFGLTELMLWLGVISAAVSIPNY